MLFSFLFKISHNKGEVFFLYLSSAEPLHHCWWNHSDQVFCPTSCSGFSDFLSGLSKPELASRKSLSSLCRLILNSTGCPVINLSKFCHVLNSVATCYQIKNLGAGFRNPHPKYLKNLWCSLCSAGLLAFLSSHQPAQVFFLSFLFDLYWFKLLCSLGLCDDEPAVLFFNCSV